MNTLRWKALTHLIGARIREFFREPEVIFWVYGFPLALAIGLSFGISSTAPAPPDVDVAETPDRERAERVAHKLRVGRTDEEKQAVEILPLEACKKRFRMGKTALYLTVEEKETICWHDPTRAESAQARFWVEAALLRDAAGNAGVFRVEEISEPGARYVDFLLPGLIGTNIMGGGLFGVGFVLVDMRVRKLFKRLMATPMRHSDFLLSLLISRLLFLLPEMTILVSAGTFGLKVPIEGSLFTLLIVILVGASAFAGIGLLLGCRTEKTESISGMLNAVMIPMYVFGGVFFSSKRFPDEVQPIIQALPLTQLNDALREVMLEGASLWDIGWRLGILAAYAVVTFALALRWFKWR